MSLNLHAPQTEAEMKPRINVFGVGGAGCNAVNNMIRANLEGVEFVVTNTDAQSLTQSLCSKRIQLGAELTQGLGAGSKPETGRAAAEEAEEDILAHLDGANMVFITAGMGGGTGTGAAPVIAKLAKERGILTVGVVTKPFHFEGKHRMNLAESGIEELTQYVDTLIIIPNQNLFRIANEKTTFADAFNMADDVLHSGVRGVTDLMIMPGLINLDFADIKTVMSEMGKAMMGTGEAGGDRRAIEATERAISNPLLEDASMKGARGVLINITGGLDMTLFEVDEAANRIREEVDPNANIIFGSTFDPNMEGVMRVSVVATGIDAENHIQMKLEKQAMNMFQERSKLAQFVATDDDDETSVKSDERAALGTLQQRAEEETEEDDNTEDAFIPPIAVNPDELGESEQDEQKIERPDFGQKPKEKKPSLFERLTGIRSRTPEKQASNIEDFTPKQEPQVTSSDPQTATDDELLDIPAFLRRKK